MQCGVYGCLRQARGPSEPCAAHAEPLLHADHAEKAGQRVLSLESPGHISSKHATMRATNHRRAPPDAGQSNTVLQATGHRRLTPAVARFPTNVLRANVTDCVKRRLTAVSALALHAGRQASEKGLAGTWAAARDQPVQTRSC